MKGGSKMILNLTQHPASAEQVEAGVKDVTPKNKREIVSLLTFESLPEREEIVERARAIAALALSEGLQSHENGTPFSDSAMIGGAPFMMGALEEALVEVGVRPLYAFSLRESVEETSPSGEVKKVSVFRHLGFVDGIDNPIDLPELRGAVCEYCGKAVEYHSC